MHALQRYLDDILVTCLSTTKKSVTQVQRLLSARLNPGVIVAAERSMNSDVMAVMRKAMERNPHSIKWELCISDTVRTESINVECRPMRMVADGVVERGLILACQGEQRGAAVREEHLQKFVEEEIGNNGKVWWTREELEDKSTCESDDAPSGASCETRKVKDSERLCGPDRNEDEEDLRYVGMDSDYRTPTPLLALNRRQHCAVPQKPRRQNDSPAGRSSCFRFESEAAGELVGDIPCEDGTGGGTSGEVTDPRDDIAPCHGRLKQRGDLENDSRKAGKAPLKLETGDKRNGDIHPWDMSCGLINNSDPNRSDGKLLRQGSLKVEGAREKAEGPLQTSCKDGITNPRPKIFPDHGVLGPATLPSCGNSKNVSAEDNCVPTDNFSAGSRDRAKAETANIYYKVKEEESDRENSSGVEDSLRVGKLPGPNKRLYQDFKFGEDSADADWRDSGICKTAHTQTDSHSKIRIVRKEPEHGSTMPDQGRGCAGGQSVYVKDASTRDTLADQNSHLHRGRGRSRQSFEYGTDLDEPFDGSPSIRMTSKEPAKRGGSAGHKKFDDHIDEDEPMLTGSSVGADIKKGPKRVRRRGRQSFESSTDLIAPLPAGSHTRTTGDGSHTPRNHGAGKIIDNIARGSELSSIGSGTGTKHDHPPRASKLGGRRSVFDDSNDVDEPYPSRPGSRTNCREPCTGPRLGARKISDDSSDRNETNTAFPRVGSNRGNISKRGIRPGRSIFDDLTDVDQELPNGSATGTKREELVGQVKHVVRNTFDELSDDGERLQSGSGSGTSRGGSSSHVRRTGRQSFGNSADHDEPLHAWSKKENGRENGDDGNGFKRGLSKVRGLQDDLKESDLERRRPTSEGRRNGNENEEENRGSGYEDDDVTPLTSSKRKKSEESMDVVRVNRKGSSGATVVRRKRNYGGDERSALFAKEQVAKPRRVTITGRGRGRKGEKGVKKEGREKRKMRQIGKSQGKHSLERERWRESMAKRSTGKGRDLEETERIRREKQGQDAGGEESSECRRRLSELRKVSEAEKQMGGKKKEGGGNRWDEVVCLDGTFSGKKNEVNGGTSADEGNQKKGRRESGGRVEMVRSRRKGRGPGARDESRREKEGRVKKKRSGGTKVKSRLEGVQQLRYEGLFSKGRRLEWKGKVDEALKCYLECVNIGGEEDDRLVDRVMSLAAVKAAGCRRGGEREKMAREPKESTVVVISD